MANINDLYAPACEAACSDNTLLSVSDVCFSNAVIEESEIIGIYLSEPAALNPLEPKNKITGWVATGLPANPAVNKTAITTWIGTVNNSSAGGLRFLEGIGDKPEPTTTEVTGARGITARIGKKHVLNFDSLTIDNLNYEFFRKLDKCGGRVFLWYATKNYLYGGINGIEAVVTKAPHILARGTGSIAVNTLEFVWKADTDIVRDENPL